MRSVLAAAVFLPALPAPAEDGVCGEWQFVQTPEVPTGSFGSSQFRDVTVLASDDVWAVGYTQAGAPSWDTLTLAMHWDGTGWTVVETPNPGGDRISSLEAVAAVASDDIWAAGIKEVHMDPEDPFSWLVLEMLIIHWDGTSWEEVDLSELGPLWGSWLNTIEVVGTDDIWFGGEWGAALALHWDGSDFEVLPTPVFDTGSCSGTFGCGHEIEAMAAVATDDVWAVGGAGDGDYSFVSQIFHWDGQEWAHVPGPSVPHFQRLSGVVALASDDVWAAGNLTAEDPDDDGLLIVHWDGSQWSRVETPLFDQPFGDVQDFVAFAPDNIWAAGIYTAQPLPAIGLPLTMHFDGTDWLQVMPDPDGPEGAWLRGMAAADPCDLWAVGSQSDFPHVQHLMPTSEPSDLDGDGYVGAADLAILLGSWGPCSECGDCPADLDGDCTVGAADLAILLGNWG